MTGEPITRRNLLQTAAVSGAAAELVSMAVVGMAQAADESYDAIVVGTGFGGMEAAIALWKQGKKVLLVERGQFYVTPEQPGMPPPQTAPKIAVSRVG